MDQGGETPGIEQAPPLPDRAVEAPVEGASFETPAAPAAEQPAAPAAAASVAAPAPAPAPAVQKDEVMKKVEQVLEEGLGDAYHKMNPQLRHKFSVEGDKAATTIAGMVRAAKVQARSVLSIISKWLKIIPGVSRFFLDQEAKIKTDKIIELAGKEKLL